MNFSKFFNYQYTPSIPGMDLGNFSGFYDPKLLKPKSGPTSNIYNDLPGFKGRNNEVNPMGNYFETGGFPGTETIPERIEKKNPGTDWLKEALEGNLDDFNYGGKQDQTMADVLGKYIGNTTMKSQMEDAAKYGKEALMTKFGLDTAKQSLNNIAAGMQATGQNLLNASTKTGLGIMQLASKPQPGMQTVYNFNPLAGSYFNYV